MIIISESRSSLETRPAARILSFSCCFFLGGGGDGGGKVRWTAISGPYERRRCESVVGSGGILSLKI